MVHWCVLVHCGAGGIKNYQLVEIPHDQTTIEVLFVLHKLEQFGQQIVPNLEDMRTHVLGGDKTLGHSNVFNWERVNPQTQTQGWKLKTINPIPLGITPSSKVSSSSFGSVRDVIFSGAKPQNPLANKGQ